MTIPEDKHVERFRQMVLERLGLRIDDSGTEHLVELLCYRLRKMDAGRPEDYLDRIGGPVPDREEWRVLAGELAIGETFFFRYPAQFEALAGVVLPELIDRRRDGELRLLSAGCASGEEAYSLAMVVREGLGGQQSREAWCQNGSSEPAQKRCLSPFPFPRIVGVDFSRPLLELAAAAHYSPWSLRGMSDERRERWFRRERGGFSLDDELRGMVAFEERNLIEEDDGFWRPDWFDVIFFRNVSIYFSTQTTRAVTARMTRSLAPGGYLFLGPSETLRGVSHDFHLRHTHEAFYYQRLRPGEHGVGAPRRSGGSVGRPAPGSAAIESASSGSWVEAIGRASTRIAALSEQHGRGAARRAGAAGSRVEQGPSGGRAGRAYDLAPAWALLGQERFADALKALEKLPIEAADDPDVLLMRAALLTNSGNITEAEALCRALLARDELDAGAHFLAALCREHAGDPAGAVEHGQTALYLDPGFAMACFHLGRLAKRSGDLETARRELGQALQLLEREHPSRILLFGGGFSRQALIQLCRAELRACGGPR